MTQYARYEIDGSIFYGRLEGDRLHRMHGSPFNGGAASGDIDALDVAQLRAPLAAPRIIGVGANYKAHIAEMNLTTPIRPMLFMKPSSAVVGPGDPVIYPHEGQTIHHEAELAIVIGKSARRIAVEHADQIIFGYTCANDISERVIQKEEMAQGCLLISKGFDSFCPLGPVIATGLDSANLHLQARINGQTRQSSSTSDLLFSVPELVSYISQAITLLPGDVIMTGTPSGVGEIKPGDLMEIELEGVGILANPVVAETDQSRP